jgi:hypothetical protein
MKILQVVELNERIEEMQVKYSAASELATLRGKLMSSYRCST